MRGRVVPRLGVVIVGSRRSRPTTSPSLWAGSSDAGRGGVQRLLVHHDPGGPVQHVATTVSARSASRTPRWDQVGGQSATGFPTSVPAHQLGHEHPRPFRGRHPAAGQVVGHRRDRLTRPQAAHGSPAPPQFARVAQPAPQTRRFARDTPARTRTLSTRPATPAAFALPQLVGIEMLSDSFAASTASSANPRGLL
jgi:hypothetical protein